MTRLTRWVGLFAALCLACLPAMAGTAAPVSIAVPYIPPWGFVQADGKPAGIAVDWARAILDRAGLEGDILPLKAEQLAQLGAKAPAFMIVAHTHETSPPAPIAKLTTLANLAVAAPEVRLRSPEDLVTIGPIAVTARSPFNPGLLTDPRLDIVEVASIENALPLLASGRVKAVVGIGPVIDAVARKLGLTAELGDRLTLDQGEGWLVANPALGAAPRSASAALERAVRGLVADGTLERILNAGLIAAAQGGRCDQVIVSADADYEPVTWYDGSQFHGAAEAILGRALQRAGIPYEFRFVGPFKRMIAAAEIGGIDIVAEMKRTPEREAFMVFPPTPVFVNPVAVFTRRDRNLVIHRREDLVSLSGGMVLGNVFGGGLDEYIAKSLSIDEIPTIDVGFTMLQANHLDYFLTGYYPGMTYLKNQHQEAQFTVQQPYLVATENFIGISKKSPCLGRLAALDGVLAQMQHDGEIARLFEAATADWRKQIERNE